jgi:hypothetical protein
MKRKLFSINKKESLVDILKRYSEKEVREAIPKAFEGHHFSKNPPKTVEPKEKKAKGVTGIKGVFF